MLIFLGPLDWVLPREQTGHDVIALQASQSFGSEELRFVIDQSRHACFTLHALLVRPPQSEVRQPVRPRRLAEGNRQDSVRKLEGISAALEDREVPSNRRS